MQSLSKKPIPSHSLDELFCSLKNKISLIKTDSLIYEKSLLEYDRDVKFHYAHLNLNTFSTLKQKRHRSNDFNENRFNQTKNCDKNIEGDMNISLEKIENVKKIFRQFFENFFEFKIIPKDNSILILQFEKKINNTQEIIKYQFHLKEKDGLENFIVTEKFMNDTPVFKLPNLNKKILEKFLEKEIKSILKKDVNK